MRNAFDAKSGRAARLALAAALAFFFILPSVFAGGGVGQDTNGFVDGDGNIVGPCTCCAGVSCEPPNPPVPSVSVQPVIIEAGFTFTNYTGVFTCNNCASIPDPVCTCSPAIPDVGTVCGPTVSSKEYRWKMRTWPGGTQTDTVISSGSDFSDVRYECDSSVCGQDGLVWLEIYYRCDATFTCQGSPISHPVGNGFYSNSSEIGLADFAGFDHYPAQPEDPIISPSWIFPDGTLTCLNCPTNVPYDAYHPAGYPFTWNYIWALNGTQIQEGPSPMLDCSTIGPGCQAAPKGSTGCGCDLGNVTLVAYVFDQNGFSNVSNKSNVAIVTDEAPEFNPTLVVFAIAIPLFAIAIAYMGTYLLSVPHYRPILQDELLQVMATAVILLCILTVSSIANNYLSIALYAANNSSSMPASPTITGAMNIAFQTLKGLDSNVSAIYFGVEGTSNDLGREASKSIFCNFKGVGFTLVNCSPLNAFRGAMMPAGFASSAAIMDLYAQRVLLSFARYTAFNMLIPVGLLFRCFKFSRGAGNALIAVGFGFYTVYPLTIVATDRLLHGSNPSTTTIENFMAGHECDPTLTNTDKSRDYVVNRAKAMTSFDMVNSAIYIVIVRVVLGSILNLIITLGFIRMFARILGSELDISSLARIS